MTYQDWIGKLLLGRYRPVRVLAEGGQGVVYLARAEGGVDGFVRPVVVKRILPQQAPNENNTRLFLREAKLLSEMSHPGVLSIVDLDEVDGEYVMVLEYVKGSHVGRWAQYRMQKGARVPWEFAAYVCATVAEALHHVHTREDANGVPYGIVHRDVSPANILLNVSGAVKLADFGIARREGDKTEQISGADVVRGNFSFVSPEVFVGGRPTAAADIYSLGMVLHWLISGERAQKGETLNETIYKALYVAPDRLDVARPEVPSELADLVAQAIEKEPQNRVSDAREFSVRLLAMLPPDAASWFAEAVAADMAADDFAASLGVPSLRELEASWRDFSPAAPTQSLATPLRTGTPAEVVTRGWVLAAMVVTLLAGSLWMGTRPPRPAGPSEFILVRGDVTPTGDAIRDSPPATRGANSMVAADASVSGTTPSAAVDAGREEDPSVPSSQPGTSGLAPAPASARTLGRSFASRRGAVSRCAEQHLEVESLAVSIRFDANADGTVRDVTITPQTLHGTPFGICLVNVARGTQFGRLSAPLSFTIPVSVRR